MWSIAASNKIIMSEGDFNVSLPITITGVTLTSSDNIKLIIYNRAGNPIIGGSPVRRVPKLDGQENYNIRDLNLTEAESALLLQGDYQWSLIWYTTGANAMQCTLVDEAELLVR